MPERQKISITSRANTAAKGKTSDEIIAGTERGGELPPEEDPGDGPVESEAAEQASQPVNS